MKLSATSSKSAANIDTIQQDIESTRAALSDKIELLRGRIQHDAETATKTVTDAVDTVKNAFSIEHHVRQRPWTTFGGAIAIGFAVGAALRSSRPSRFTAALPPLLSRLQATPHADNSSNGAYIGSEPFAALHPPQGTTKRHLADQFGTELKLAKGLAIGAAAGVLRDLAVSALPSVLSPHAVEVLNRFTQSIGGTPIGKSQNKMTSFRNRSDSDAEEKQHFSSPV